jgi:signal transduction histidine kinase
VSVAPEARLLLRTRRQLMLWSAGSTLLVLLLLGGTLYAALARQLATDGEAQLRARAATLQDVAERAAVRPGFRGPRDIAIATDPSSVGFVFGGGPASGTIAVVVAPNLDLSTATLFDPDGVQAARSGDTLVTETEVDGTPVRVLSQPIARRGGTYVLQVVGDRTGELRTLQVSVAALLVVGVLAVGLAAALGWLYAGRALVPIRESIRRQREFAADASHELRTPLTVIRGNLRTLAAGAGTAPSGAQREALEDIEGEVTRMTSLVEQLLLLARTDSDALELEIRPADLAEEATDALQGFAPVAVGKGVRLTLDVEPAPLRADALRLRQLVAILVDNAVRHAPSHGQVRVTVREASGRATLRVEDDGPGIRPDDLPRVFDRFWRADDAPDGGSGLGLAIAAWIVERHGGRIRVENGPSGGARFTAELPAR